jgi:7 transmembrane sweet-taste receptor of 3 GCPR
LILFTITSTGNIIILAVMTAKAPIPYKIIVQKSDRFGRTVQSFGRCVFTDSIPFLIPLACIIFGLMIMALFQAWRARNLSTEFAETESIFRSLLVSMMAAFLGISGLLLARDNPDASSFMASSVVFILCANMILCVFIPKLRFERKQRKARDGQRHRLGRLEMEIGTGNVQITGIDGILDTQEAAMEGSRIVSSEVPDGADVTNRFRSNGSTDSVGVGERILAMKPKHQLAEEVESLRYLLAAKQKQEEHLGEENARLRSILRQHGWKDTTGTTRQSIDSMMAPSTSFDVASKHAVPSGVRASTDHHRVSTATDFSCPSMAIDEVVVPVHAGNQTTMVPSAEKGISEDVKCTDSIMNDVESIGGEDDDDDERQASSSSNSQS